MVADSNEKYGLVPTDYIQLESNQPSTECSAEETVVTLSYVPTSNEETQSTEESTTSNDESTDTKSNETSVVEKEPKHIRIKSFDQRKRATGVFVASKLGDLVGEGKRRFSMVTDKKKRASVEPSLQKSVAITSKPLLNMARRNNGETDNKSSPLDTKSPTFSPKSTETVPQRVNIIAEIRETEKKYLESLDILSKTYLADLHSKKILTVARELEALQSILGIIISFNIMLNKQLRESDDVGKKFLSIIPFLKTYTDYFQCYQKFETMVKVQKKENKNFTAWLAKTEQKCKSTGLLTMQMYLIMPVQRIPRYK
jgi:hypothetical protein